MWQTSFQDKLRIRFANHHSKCGQCLKHRLIMKKLGHCPAAQRLQSTMLQSHLRRQHADREIYWSARARSRIDSVQPQVFHLCGIIDSMDQQKHSWPRSRTLLAKDFVTLNRPRLSSTTFLCHGHGLYLHLSPHTVQCNGSRTCQIIMHGLSRIARSVDLRCTMVHLQGDNCSKELKNVTVLRAMSLLISERKLHGCECGFLSSGHSHEDVDAFFNRVRACFEAHPELASPQQFKRCLQDFLGDPARRPLEKDKQVYLLAEYRNWMLACNFHPISSTLQPSTLFLSWVPLRKMWLGEIFAHGHLVGVGGPGAPHSFTLLRFADAGLLSYTNPSVRLTYLTH